jgi:hypothetical protein
MEDMENFKGKKEMMKKMKELRLRGKREMNSEWSRNRFGSSNNN